MEMYILLGFVLLLSIFLGLELIAKVPSTLHTPLMSGANAISGIALVGALMLSGDGQTQNLLAFGAILFASINVLTRKASSTFNMSFCSNLLLLNINPDRKTNEYNKFLKFIAAL